MKKIFFCLLLISVMLNSAFARDIDTIAEIRISPSELRKNHDYYSVSFKLNNGRKIGKFFCYHVYELLEPHFADMPEKERRKLFFEILNKSGESIIISYFDIDPKTVILQPEIIFSNVEGNIGDTVYVWDKEGQKGQVNLEAIGREVDMVIRRTIRLQMASMNAEEKKRVFSNGTIIFPQDKTSARWLDRVTEMKIFRFAD